MHELREREGRLINYSLTKEIKTHHVVDDMAGCIVAKGTGNQGVQPTAR